MNRSKRHLVLAALLLAALIAGLWHLGSGRRGSEAASTGPLAAGAPGVFKGKKPPARDFKRRSGYTITPRAEGEKADPESPPHPLDAEIAARAERWKVWRTTKADLNYTDRPLDEVLADLATRYGLKFLISPGLELHDKTVTFKVVELAADQTLDLIFKMADLDWVLTADGTMVVLPNGADASEWEKRDSAELQEMETAQAERTKNKRENEKDDKNEAYWAGVKGKTLPKTVASNTMYDSLDALQETLQLNMVLSTSVRKAMWENPPTMPDLVAGRSVPDTFDAWVSGAGLGWKVENGLMLFGMADEIQKAKEVDDKRRAERTAREGSLATLLARKVTVSGDNLAIRQLAELLGGALGVPVKLDPETWHRAARVTIDDTPRTGLDIVRIIQAAAPVEVALRDGVLWFLGPVPPLKEWEK